MPVLFFMLEIEKRTTQTMFLPSRRGYSTTGIDNQQINNANKLVYYINNINI